LAILQNPAAAYQSVVPYTVDESIAAITNLLNYSEISTL
jgi:hypothetical protein